MKTIFEFTEVSQILRWKADENQGIRKYKTKMAEAANCHLSYLSGVLGRRARLTPDQALGLSEFWRLNSKERDFFIELVHLERAGSESLKKLLGERLQKMRADAASHLRLQPLTQVDSM